jgi:hypothetical protein
MASQVDKLHTCKHCLRVIIMEDQCKPPEKGGKRYCNILLPHTKEEARQAALEGCPLFKCFVYAFEEATTSENIWELVRFLTYRSQKSLVMTPRLFQIEVLKILQVNFKRDLALGLILGGFNLSRGIYEDDIYTSLSPIALLGYIILPLAFFHHSLSLALKVGVFYVF